MRHLLACLAILAAFNVNAQIDGFQLPYNPDSEPDGYIGVGDVLEVLSIFGSQWNASDIYLNDDSTDLYMDMGQVHVAKCLAICDALPGSWRMGNLTDFGNIMDQIPAGGIPWFIQDDRLDIPNVDAVSTMPGISSSIGKISYGPPESGYAAIYQLDYDDVFQENRCLCATQERPKVEYLVFDPMESISTDGAVEFDSWLNEKAQEGWKLMPTPSGYAEPGTWVFLWRWAD
jgi:hypothetical protein